MLTPFVIHRRPGRPWWLGLALAWAALPIAAQPASPPAAPSAPQPQAVAASAPCEPQVRPGDADEPAPTVQKAGARAILIDFDSSTLDPETLKTISQSLWSRLDAMADVAVYPRAATRRWLIRQDLFPFTPYMPPPPPERITAALKAEYLITGHLNRCASGFNLDISVFSDRTRQYTLKDYKLEKGTEAELLEALTPLSVQLHQALTGGVVAPGTPSVKTAKSVKSVPATATAAAKAPVRSCAKPKATAAARKAPASRVRVVARPRAAAQHATSRKTKRTAAPPSPAEATDTPRAKAASRIASDEQDTAPAAAQPTPAPTPRPTPPPEAPAKPATTPAPTATPAPANAADAEVQQQLALEQYSQGNYEACIVQCKQAIARLPKVAMLHVIEGSALYELGRYDQAIKANRQALALEPHNVWGLFNLALALTRQAPAQAIPAWREFIATFGNDPQHKALIDQARASLAELEAAQKTKQ